MSHVSDDSNSFPADVRRPLRLLLGLLFLLLALSHLYPQLAYPMRGVPIGAGLVLLGAAGAVAAFWVGGGNAKHLALMAVAVAWPIWWVIELQRAPVPAMGREAVATILQGGLLFLAVLGLAFAARASARRSLAAPVALFLAGLGTVLAAHALYQFYGPEGWPGTHATLRADLEALDTGLPEDLRAGLLHLLSEGRASGRFGSANVFAGLLAVLMMPALGRALQARAVGERLVWTAAAALMGAAIVLSGSRGGLLAAVLGVLLLGALAMRWRRFGAGVAAAMMLVVMMGAVDTDHGRTSQGPASGRATSAVTSEMPSEFSRRWLGVTTVRQRMFYWQTGLEIWSVSPVLGRGPGAYSVFYPMHRRPGAQETAFAHNWLVQWGTETGIVGLLLFGAWAGAALVLGFRWWRRADGARALAAAMLAAAAVALAGGLIEFTLQFREPYLVLALLLGVLSAEGLATWEPSASSPRLPGSLPLAAGAAVLLFGGAAVFAYQYRPAMADHYSELAQEAESPAEAVAHYAAAIRYQPDDAALHEALGHVRLVMGDPWARTHFETAQRLNPYSARLHQSMAQYEAATGRLHEAIAWQQQAVALHPLDATHRLYLAELLILADRREEAREMVRATEGLLVSTRERAERERLAGELGLVIGD